MDIDSEILNLKGYLIREDFYIALVFEGVFIYDVFSLEFICSFSKCAHVLCIYIYIKNKHIVCMYIVLFSL